MAMIKTCKVPTEERTVSGSSVSFNSAFALPLKACKVSFSATQAGSGDPSPSNPRAISGVSAIGLTANSTPVSVSLGDTRYGGYVDVVNSKLVLTHYHFVPDSNTVIQLYDHGSVSSLFRIRFDSNNIPVGVTQTVISSHFSRNISTGSGYLYNNSNGILLSIANNLITPENTTGLKAWFIANSVEFVYEMATPIEISLSDIPDLSSIIGNNTFSTDTGTLEITFADLQEKSASGAVATFNTALAMPLSSCNIAVNAWQEGSGDPSPSNVRAIHGFSEVNTIVGSGNLYNGTLGGYNELSLKAGKQLILQGDMSNDVYLVLRVYDENKTRLQAATTILGTGTRYGVMTLNSDISYYSVERSSQSGVYNNTMLSFGNTVKPYTPYVTPTIYTIQLGQEVYGAEVDVVNGVMNDSSFYVVFNGSENWSLHSSGAFMITVSPLIDYTDTKSICNMFKWTQKATTSLTNGEYKNAGSSFYFKNTDISTLEDWKNWLSTHNLQLVATKTNSDEVQLTPMQIKTIIGNNTIFADTGDIDLTYKDLDIAKRGNFREVFKLP